MTKSSVFDGRGLKCPLAFVKAKQSFITDKTKVYLFDDTVSLYNFTNYIEKEGQTFLLEQQESHSQVVLIDPKT